MDVVAIQNELESLPSDQQDRISAFLTTLRMKRQGLMAEITRRLDDDDEGKWELQRDRYLESSGTLNRLCG